MDFIERWFHLSPDNGSGTTEAMFIAVGALLVGAIVWRCLQAGRAKRAADRLDKDRQ